MTAHVAVGAKADDDATLTGPTGYKGINKVVLTAEVDKGDMGVAEFKSSAACRRESAGCAFLSAKAPPTTPTGRTATVTTEYKEKKTTHKVADLQPLYRTASGEQLSPVLWFRKTLKVDVSKIRKITANASEDEPAWTVTDKDGEQTLTPLSQDDDRRQAGRAGGAGPAARRRGTSCSRRTRSARCNSRRRTRGSEAAATNG